MLFFKIDPVCLCSSSVASLVSEILSLATGCPSIYGMIIGTYSSVARSTGFIQNLLISEGKIYLWIDITKELNSTDFSNFEICFLH